MAEAVEQKKVTHIQWLLVEINTIGTERKLRLDPPVQYVNNRNHGQNPSSTPGKEKLFQNLDGGCTVQEKKCKTILS